MPIATTLLGRLREINNAIDRGDPRVISSIVQEAEECVLQMEQEVMASLIENERLRTPAGAEPVHARLDPLRYRADRSGLRSLPSTAVSATR
jgi:hypothetical protein